MKHLLPSRIQWSPSLRQVVLMAATSLAQERVGKAVRAVGREREGPHLRLGEPVQHVAHALQRFVELKVDHWSTSMAYALASSAVSPCTASTRASRIHFSTG